MRTLLLVLLSPAVLLADDPAIDYATILDKIRKGSPSDCIEAIGKLTPGKEERAAKPIAVRLVTEADAQAKAALREALAAYKGSVLVQAVKTGLETKGVTDEYRTMALELLGPEKGEAAILLVGKIAFESELKAMREAGQKTMAGFGDEAVKCTSSYVRSSDQKIATEAVATLQAIGTIEAGKALTGCLAIGSEKELLRIAKITSKTRDDAVTALTAMGDNAVPGLLLGLDGQLYQKWCAYVLTKISGEFHTQKDKAAWLDWWKRHQAEKAGR